MVEERKNATKTVTCQIDDLRLVAGNVICLVSAGLKIRLPELYPLLKISRIWRCATLLMRQPPAKFQLLFDFDLRACGLDLFLDLLRLLFGHAFLDCFGSALDQRFRLSEA